MNKILLVIIALIVVFGSFIFLGNKKTNPTTKQSKTTESQQTTPIVTEPNNPAVTISLTDLGFAPKDIAIKTGTRIVWLNKSGKAATVSSDDHPTHRLYPFLNLGTFADGSSVQVIVEKSGEYSYHNHLNTSEVGTITVQ